MGAMGEILPTWVGLLEEDILNLLMRSGVASAQLRQSNTSMQLMCVQIGQETWQTVSASPYTSPFNQGLNFMSVRDFERDITTWSRAWGSPEFFLMDRFSINMHEIIQHLLLRLRLEQSHIEVAYPKLLKDMVTVVVRERHMPAVQFMFAFPMYSSQL